MAIRRRDHCGDIDRPRSDTGIPTPERRETHTPPPPGASGTLAVRNKKTTEPAVLVCDRLTATYQGSTEPTIRDLSFHLPSGGLLAVVGPSGSGKSTLCAALLGEVRDTRGQILLGGADLLRDTGAARRLVSFVPQHDALHHELTPRQALRYVAELRLRRTHPEDRAIQVDQVLDLLDLRPQANQRIGLLSGGQRKRVAVAMELMSRPRLLILDEPTAGLDEGLDLLMMSLLRTVADAGTAIIVVTHSTANLELADAVLAMGRDGRMSYCGPPGGMLSAFRSETHAEAMQALRAGARAVGSGPVVIGNDPVAVPVHPEVRARLAEPGPGLAQVTSVLLRREIRRMRSGPLTLARGTLLLPVLAIVLTALASDRGLSGTPGDPNRMQVAALSVLITCTTFFAMALSFSSIVGERAVIEREFRWEVPASGVVLSKGLALIPLVLAQSVITMTGYLVWRPGPDTPLGTVPSWLVLGTGLSALGLCSMSLGLLISAAAPRLDRAVFGLMGVVALLVVLNGLLIPLGNPSSIGGDVLAALSQLAPTRWGTAAIAAEMGFVPNEVMARGGTVSDDPLWGHDFHHVVVALMALIALGGSYLLGAAELLVTQSRRRR